MQRGPACVSSERCLWSLCPMVPSLSAGPDGAKDRISYIVYRMRTRVSYKNGFLDHDDHFDFHFLSKKGEQILKSF